MSFRFVAGVGLGVVALRHMAPPLPFVIKCKSWRKERISNVRHYNLGLFSVVRFTRTGDYDSVYAYSNTHTHLTLFRPDIWIDGESSELHDM
jgi:hypothetical protein